MKSLRSVVTLGLLSGVLSGCGFWGGTSEIEPTPLVSITAEKQVETLWSTDVGSGYGDLYHQFVPAVDGKAIYAANRDGVVVALDRESGRQLWKQDLDLTLSGGIGAGFGTLVVASEEGNVIALNAEDGSELWRGRVPSEVVSQPQLNTDLVVVQVINGQIDAFDRVTGEHRWSFDSQVPQLSLRGTSEPLLGQDVTLAGFANGKLVAIDNRVGNALWEQRVALAEGRSELERIVDVDGKPLFFNDLIYVPSYQGRLVAINPFAARIVWAQDFSSYRGLAAGFGNVYGVSDQDLVSAFDAGSSASVWQQDGLRYRRLTSPAVLGTTLVVGDAEGYLHFLSQIDGHFVARYHVDSAGIYSTPVVADDTLYVLSNDGRLVALKLN